MTIPLTTESHGDKARTRDGASESVRFVVAFGSWVQYLLSESTRTSEVCQEPPQVAAVGACICLHRTSCLSDHSDAEVDDARGSPSFTGSVMRAAAVGQRYQPVVALPQVVLLQHVAARCQGSFSTPGSHHGCNQHCGGPLWQRQRQRSTLAASGSAVQAHQPCWAAQQVLDLWRPSSGECGSCNGADHAELRSWNSPLSRWPLVPLDRATQRRRREMQSACGAALRDASPRRMLARRCRVPVYGAHRVPPKPTLCTLRPFDRCNYPTAIAYEG